MPAKIVQNGTCVIIIESELFPNKTCYFFMQLEEAIQLIDKAPVDNKHPTQWADLGSGAGLFAQALSTLLAPASKLYAIDQSKQTIKAVRDDVAIEFLQADFTNINITLPLLNGIVMANSLHYVRNKPALIQNLKPYLHPNAGFIIVEYDLQKANQWVPYPVNPGELQQLFFNEGYSKFEITGTKKSAYNEGLIYACYIGNQ
jgi:ubiquinone/menaquinone biosynthesis C-methylase UbiE